LFSIEDAEGQVQLTHIVKKLTIAVMYLVVFIFIGCGEDDGISESTLGRLSGKRIVP
jgi:hypothetical protein